MLGLKRVCMMKAMWTLSLVAKQVGVESRGGSAGRTFSF
jgi:hypothetical protein